LIDMGFDELRVVAVPGDGVVGRWPGVLCVAQCADRDVLRRLLDVCAAAASGAEPGRVLARQLAMWLGGADAPGDELRFGTLADTGERWAVFLFGTVGVTVPGSDIALSGADSVAWTDRLLPRQPGPVELMVDGAAVPPDVVDGVFDLRAGVVAGAGAVLVPDGGGPDALRRHGVYGDPAPVERPERHPQPAAPDADSWFAHPDGPGGSGGSGRTRAARASARGSHDASAGHPGGDPSGRRDEPPSATETDRFDWPAGPPRAWVEPGLRGEGTGHPGLTRAPHRRNGARPLVGGSGHGLPGAHRPGDAGRRRRPDEDERSAEPLGTDPRGLDPGSIERAEVERAEVERAEVEKAEVERAELERAEVERAEVERAEVGRAEVERNGAGGDDVEVRADFGGPDAERADRDRTDAERTDLGRTDRGRTGAGRGSEAVESGAAGAALDPAAEPGTPRAADAAETGPARPGSPGTDRVPRQRDNVRLLRPVAPPHAQPDVPVDGAAAPAPAVPPDEWRRGPGTVPESRTGAEERPAGEAESGSHLGSDEVDDEEPGWPEPDSGRWFAPERGPDPDHAAAAEPAGPHRSRHERWDEPGHRGGEDGTPKLGVPQAEPQPTPDGPGPETAERVNGVAAGGAPVEDEAFAGTDSDADVGHGEQDTGQVATQAGGADDRPLLGALVFDDGASYAVDAEYVVGRMPEADERVRAGRLRPLVVEDRSGAVSRVHAEIRVDGWDVLLVDSGSRNGTFVAAPGEQGWTALPARQSRRLVPGTRVRLGGRTFVFEPPAAG
jgi:hypothetical protein